MLKKYKFKFILTLTVIIVINVICSCSDLPEGIEQQEEVASELDSKWMSYIADKTKLFSINIPGSHDTCALYDFVLKPSTAAAQSMTLEQQLEFGVRMIDIRPYREADGSYTIHHGIVYQHISFEEVLEICYKFLQENPSETIIFSYQNENDSCDREDTINYIMEQICKKPEYWLYSGENDRSKLTTDITLGDARGKMVLIKRFKNQTGFGLCERTDFHFVEPGATSDIDSAWTERLNMLETVREGNNAKYGSLWLSGYYIEAFGIPNIKKLSNVINPKFISYIDNLDKSKKYHFGMLVLDQITPEIIRKIYMLNFSE